MTFDSLELRGLGMRRLRYAILASLLLHLLLLWPELPRLPGKDTPALLQATLKLPPQPSAAPPPVVAAATPILRPPAPKPERLVLEQPRLSWVPPTLVLPADPVLKPPLDATPMPMVAATPAPAFAGSASGSLVTEANASGEAADGLRGYRLAVASQARRFKRYPTQAMAAGWAGSAEIRVEVGSEGRPRPAAVVRSSGHEALDSAALAMIDAGAERARLPESLRGKRFAVVLPVVFNLEDE